MLTMKCQDKVTREQTLGEYISRAFPLTRHISINLIELSLINILAPPSARGSTFHVIMIT
jgi:hypothetical protein